ncbi:MAG TPA: beta-propeller fold lactonase family protein [Streptosporangiaceae bacterium]|nr:beta-propeller fold lactonase family protein [Streptosporangiaceae bacterium]
MRGLFTLATAGFVVAALLIDPGLVASPAAGAAPSGRSANPSVAYVVNESQGLVTPVNTVTRLAGLPVKVGSHPEAIAISPDGATAYVVSTGSDTVLPVDTATGKAGRPIKVGASPVAIVITPDGRTAYVADNGASSVTPIDLVSGQAEPSIAVGASPRTIAIAPDGAAAYVVGSSTVTPIVTKTGAALPPIAVGRGSRAIAITPNGRTAYVLNTDSGSITPIRTADNAALTPIRLDGLPRSIAISRDGRFAYVTLTRGGARAGGFLVPIRTGSNTALRAIRIGARPSALAITPDGSTVYVTSQAGAAGFVTPVRAAAAKALTPVRVGPDPTAVALTPDGRLAYVISGSANRRTPGRGQLTMIRTATNTILKTIGVAPDPVALALAAPRAPVTVGTSRLSPLCNNVVAHAPTLHRVGTRMTKVPGLPFGVAVTPSGHWDLATLGNFIAVVHNTASGQHVTRLIKLPQGHSARGIALTPNGKYLLVANLRAGADVIDVARAIGGKPGAWLGSLIAPQPAKGAFEAASSADSKFAFVTIAGDQEVAVFNLARAVTSGFGPDDFVGAIPAGKSNVGIATSPDPRWMYVTSEENVLGSKHGMLSVVSVAKAETDPASSVVTTVDAGCRPVRAVVSSDGKTIWVTARQSNAVLAFSAARLLGDPRHALITWVRVGVQPVGLILVNCGSELVVADSHRFKAKHGVPNLAVVSVKAALTGRPAMVGYVPSGLDPRQLAVSPDGRTLLVGNFGSGELETVNLTELPGADLRCLKPAGRAGQAGQP